MSSADTVLVVVLEAERRETHHDRRDGAWHWRLLMHARGGCRRSTWVRRGYGTRRREEARERGVGALADENRSAPLWRRSVNDAERHQQSDSVYEVVRPEKGDGHHHAMRLVWPPVYFYDGTRSGRDTLDWGDQGLPDRAQLAPPGAPRQFGGDAWLLHRRAAVARSAHPAATPPSAQEAHG